MNACADALEFSFLGLDCDLGLERGALGWAVILAASFVDTLRRSVNSRVGIIEYDDIFIELNATGFRRSPGPSEAFCCLECISKYPSVKSVECPSHMCLCPFDTYTRERKTPIRWGMLMQTSSLERHPLDNGYFVL